MMLESLKYKNHLNEVIDFGKDGIYINTNNLHDYEWKATTKNNRISALEREVSKRKLPVIIICNTEAEGIAARNRLFEEVEKDVLALQHGQIIIGDYYFRCFVTQSKKKDYHISKRYMLVTLTLTTDFPFWVKETASMFKITAENSDYLDYAYDFPHDYCLSMANTKIVNSGFVASNFRMVIYGPVVNPSVTIGGHVYNVNCTIEDGEFLTIDSVTKKIYLTANNGTVTNQFNARNRDSYIFEKIPSGNLQVAWDGDFAFDIILLEERSEPKWT